MRAPRHERTAARGRFPAAEDRCDRYVTPLLTGFSCWGHRVTAVTTTTPPGWYPEPGHTGNSPAMERWWDGSTWTEYTRTAPAPQPAQPVYPGYPSGDVIASPGGAGSRNNRN